MRSIHSKLPKNQIPCHVNLKADLDVEKDSKNEDTNTFANEEISGPNLRNQIMQISDPLLKEPEVQGVASMGVASMGVASMGVASTSKNPEVGVHPFQIKAIKTRAEALEMWLGFNGGEERKDNGPPAPPAPPSQPTLNREFKVNL